MVGDIPGAIRRQRCRQGLTIRQAAEKLDIPHNTLSRWERGQVPSRDMLAVILRWLLEGCDE